MPSRYKNRKVKTNNKGLYKEFFEERKVNYINQYTTPKIPFLDASVRAQFNSIPHTWKLGDRYYKLADQYYDDPTYTLGNAIIYKLYAKSPTGHKIEIPSSPQGAPVLCIAQEIGA